MPPILRMSTEIEDLLRCIEKEFGLTANYAKGHGSMFEQWMRVYHPTSYLYPILRACGGSRQDLGVEGAPAVLMNLPYYLQFLHWRLSISIGSDSILQRKLFSVLRSTEMVALLCVLSILHIAICLPTRWLAGNSKDLGNYDFSYYDMGKLLDIMEDRFEEISKKGELLLDEDFMMDMFLEIAEKVDPFATYLEFMFTEKQNRSVGGTNSEDGRVLPYDELRAELFYPARADIRQTNIIACRLAEDAASTFLMEFRDTSKATSAYLSSIGGKYSAARVTTEDRIACLHKEASNSIAESNHASSTHSLKTSGTIRLDSAAGEGQTRANNDFGRGHNAFVSGRSSKNGRLERTYGCFHSLPIELQQSIIETARRGAANARKCFDDALRKQKESRQQKEEIARRKKIATCREEYIVAIELWEQYHSPRCWKTVEYAQSVYGQLKSETARLNAVKEQILIRYLGLGWERTHHPWSKSGVTFSSKQLLKHLIETVIPMANELPIPVEPPIKFPSPPESQLLGTESELSFVYAAGNDDEMEEFKTSAHAEGDKLEQEGKTDRWSAKQSTIMPIVDDSFIGFNIEMLFQYDEQDGTSYVNWCHGIVESVCNAKTNCVYVKWSQGCLNPGEQSVTKEKLLSSKWNPGKATKGAWRQYFGEHEN